MKTIVKAEVLWSRICPLKCSYCAMVTNDRTPKDMSKWDKGVDNLSKLNCGFVAIYGAEPLADFEGLPEFIGILTKAGIPMTVITSCVVPNIKQKLGILYQHGLRSLSVSYDGDNSPDKSVRTKANKGLEIVRWFRDSYNDLRDVACIMTANRQNFWNLPNIIRGFTNENIWTLFDFIHPDRGQEGSKCRNTPLLKDLLFREEDFSRVVETLLEIKELKASNYKVHTSNAMLDTLIMNPSILSRANWHCLETGFPGWVTIENTGEVYSCDDFHPRERQPIYVWELFERFDEFTKLWTEYVKKCPGCFWNTHFDANRIKMGLIPINDYTHEKV